MPSSNTANTSTNRYFLLLLAALGVYALVLRSENNELRAQLKQTQAELSDARQYDPCLEK